MIQPQIKVFPETRLLFSGWAADHTAETGQRHWTVNTCEVEWKGQRLRVHCLILDGWAHVHGVTYGDNVLVRLVNGQHDPVREDWTPHIWTPPAGEIEEYNPETGQRRVLYD